MEIIKYFETENKEHWLSEIAKSDWSAGHFLYRLPKTEKLREPAGENAKVLLLAKGGKFVSFCTFANFDDIKPTKLTPRIGFVYTFPKTSGAGTESYHLWGIILMNTAETLLVLKKLKKA